MEIKLIRNTYARNSLIIMKGRNRKRGHAEHVYIWFIYLVKYPQFKLNISSNDKISRPTKCVFPRGIRDMEVGNRDSNVADLEMWIQIRFLGSTGVFRSASGIYKIIQLSLDFVYYWWKVTKSNRKLISAV